MKLYNLIFSVIICLIFTLKSQGQSRCDTTSGTTTFMLENMPECNVSIDELEIKINSTFNPNDYNIPNDYIFYVQFLINCKGEDFEYKIHKLEDEIFNKSLIDFIKRVTSWSPPSSNNEYIDIGYSYIFIIEKGKFNFLNAKERKRKIK